VQTEHIPPRREPGERVATADYIAELCADLGRMARGDGLDTLAYILDMARLEAQSLAHNTKPPAQ
jgi:hypothetical protein